MDRLIPLSSWLRRIAGGMALISRHRKNAAIPTMNSSKMILIFPLSRRLSDKLPSKLFGACERYSSVMEDPRKINSSISVTAPVPLPILVQ